MQNWEGELEAAYSNYDTFRAQGVLTAVETLSGWKTAPAKGSQRGVAVLKGFGSYVAMVAEVTKTSTGTIKVTKVSVAVDCGVVINPDQVEGQMQGGAGGRGAMSFGKSRARMMDENNNSVTFGDVAGCEEAKEEVATKLSRFVRARWFAPPFGGRVFSGLLLDAFDAMGAAPMGLGSSFQSPVWKIRP